MVDYWKIKSFDMKKLGEFVIFEIAGGDNNQCYFHVRLKDTSNFDDYANFDVRNKVIVNSDLYSSIEFDIASGAIKIYPGKINCINEMLNSLYEEVKDDEELIREYFLNISKIIATI